ncbi:hypothetical protein ENSA5_46660 [Enhygromyxa salina]|uniref:Tetratricopeptide repeat protein n=1 Tax=Enhygromyxa salina TaxID=215803 RepID=A0A2S9XIX7_9BACT|nr:hypothetical protein [Enhygromyxa salina]PRP92834.1 hypothetical protein ENSA5_46660 [Enhygromyxa salina]
MRRRWLRSALTASLLSLTLAFGCAWKGHIKKGDDFMVAANYDAAAAEYAEALRLRPDDADIAAKLDAAQSGQVEVRADHARRALAANADAQAIAFAADAHAILPSHPTTIALIDEVVSVTSERAQQKAQAQEFAAAMAIFDGISARLPSASGRVRAATEAVVQAWVAQLSAAASEAEAAGRRGSVLLYRAKIADLSGAGVAERDAARDQVAAELRYLVVVAARSADVGARAVAAALLGKVGASLLEVAAQGERRSATLSLTLGEARFSTDKSTRAQSVQYQSGTQEVENPFYKMAQDDVLDEERRLVERENEVTKQEQYVDQYSADVAREGDTPGVSTGAEQNLRNARSRLEAARRSLTDQRNAVIRAKEKAASTEQTTQEPVYSTHSFSVTTHTLTATVQATATLAHADGRPELVFDQPLSISAQDDAHAAQSVAGIAEDPLSLPSKAELAAQLHAQAVAPIAAIIDDSFAGYRQGLLVEASAATDAGEQLELLLRYVIVDPRHADPKTVADIFTLSGVPNASSLVLGGG